MTRKESGIMDAIILTVRNTQTTPPRRDMDRSVRSFSPNVRHNYDRVLAYIRDSEEAKSMTSKQAQWCAIQGALELSLILWKRERGIGDHDDIPIGGDDAIQRS
jgi:hypothetical protein